MIAEYKQVSTKTITESILIPATYDDDGNILTEEHNEEVNREVPVMGMVYRDATDEEQKAADAEAEQQYTESKFADMTDAEKMALFVSTLTEDKTNKGDNGEVLTKPVIKDGVIVYVDSGERLGTGTYTDPLQFVDGDTVTAGLYYCRCKVTASGTVTRQLTSGTYKALISGTPTWASMTGFEFAY